MKRIVRSGNVEAALRDDRFRVELNRVRDLYPDHEGRENLFELVGKETKFGLTKFDDIFSQFKSRFLVYSQLKRV